MHVGRRVIQACACNPRYGVLPIVRMLVLTCIALQKALRRLWVANFCAVGRIA